MREKNPLYRDDYGAPFRIFFQEKSKTTDTEGQGEKPASRMAVGTTASLISPSLQTTIAMSVAHPWQGIYPPLLRSHCALPVCRDKISSKRCQVPRVAELDATVWIEPLKDLFQKDTYHRTRDHVCQLFCL